MNIYISIDTNGIGRIVLLVDYHRTRNNCCPNLAPKRMITAEDQIIQI